MKHESNRGRMTVGSEMRLVYLSTPHQVFVAILLGVWGFFQGGGVIRGRKGQSKLRVPKPRVWDLSICENSYDC